MCALLASQHGIPFFAATPTGCWVSDTPPRPPFYSIPDVPAPGTDGDNASAAACPSSASTVAAITVFRAAETSADGARPAPLHRQAAADPASPLVFACTSQVALPEAHVVGVLPAAPSELRLCEHLCADVHPTCQAYVYDASARLCVMLDSGLPGGAGAVLQEDAWWAERTCFNVRRLLPAEMNATVTQFAEGACRCWPGGGNFVGGFLKGPCWVGKRQ